MHLDILKYILNLSIKVVLVTFMELEKFIVGTLFIYVCTNSSKCNGHVYNHLTLAHIHVIICFNYYTCF